MSFTEDDITMSKYKLITSSPLDAEKTLQSILYKLLVMKKATRHLEKEVSICEQIDKLSKSFESYFEQNVQE